MYQHRNFPHQEFPSWIKSHDPTAHSRFVFVLDFEKKGFFCFYFCKGCGARRVENFLPVIMEIKFVNSICKYVLSLVWKISGRAPSHFKRNLLRWAEHCNGCQNACILKALLIFMKGQSFNSDFFFLGQVYFPRSSLGSPHLQNKGISIELKVPSLISCEMSAGPRQCFTNSKDLINVCLLELT